MNLTARITSRLSLILLIVLSAWATALYFIVVEEMNDETDDSLERYAEYIIKRSLAGEELPDASNGTNNSYHITEVTQAYALQTAWIEYYDEVVYLELRRETEAARVLKTIFKDKDDRYFELIIAMPTIEKEDLQQTILLWIVILYCTLLLLIIATNWWVLRRSFVPLYGLLNWLDNFRLEKKMLDPQVDTDIAEFSKLKDAMIRSAHRNVEAYEQQKTFIGNASHELQTPLAICRNRLDMLMEEGELNEQQLEELFKIKQAIDRLIKLNKTLLLLTKIENHQFTQLHSINVNELISVVLTDLLEVYESKQIVVDVKETGSFNLKMNEQLASILFSNLLKNAFVHNFAKGLIHIVISADRVTVSNTGRETVLDKNSIFERFYKGEKREHSTGLGLALSKSICASYGLHIGYYFDKNLHVFSISL